MLNHRKAAVIGCGFVGSSIAFSLIQRGLFSELVLIDANQDKAVGEAMDLSHGLPYIAAMDVHAGGYDDLSDCALVVVTAGANQKPGQTRLELIGQNVAILNSIIPQITARPFEGILLIVSNPVDVLTYAAFRISGYPAHRVMGSGTVLDSARLRYLLGEHLNVDSRSIHAVIVGEHGTVSWRCGAGPTCPERLWTISAPCGAALTTRAPGSASMRTCGTALTRSSSGRGPPTTASPWRWHGSRSAS